ncbi:MAG: hypothetical protein DCC75_01640 [Proteobacteria bacterium]|nr:MAG: hypothetical protein DCC75_01640 [Pseudomonadota bacterium]
MAELEELEDLEELARLKGRALNWLEKMGSCLSWKVIGPDIHNPYAPVLPERMLFELAYRTERLKKILTVRCMCEGYEVMQIKNLQSPMIITDHPCVNAMTYAEIYEFLEEYGVNKKVEEEITRIQEEIKALLGKKEQEEENDKSPKARKNKPGKKESQKVGNKGFRVIKK